jgi:hypothetical protein
MPTTHFKERQMALPLIARLVAGLAGGIARNRGRLAVRVDMSDLERKVAKLARDSERQVRFATAVALTRTARAVPAAASKELESVFDKPKPFTTKPSAFFTQPATKARQYSVVGFKDAQARYMRFGITGGVRVPKGFERKLSALGILPSGWIVTPGAGAALDGHGNIPLRTLNKIVESLQKGAPGRTGRWFVVRPGAPNPRTRHLHPGIYQARGRDLKPVLLFSPSAAYEPRFDFAGVVQKVKADKFNEEFRRAYNKS